MTTSNTSGTLSSKLSALVQRFGLSERVSRMVFERSRQLQLPFRALPPFKECIWWHEGTPLHRLANLPRDAFSGPVQEDKAAARAALMPVIEMHEEHVEQLDLRRIDGLCAPRPADVDAAHEASLDLFAAGPCCRKVRIISYKDFLRSIGKALPRFAAGEAVELRQADWRGGRLFWTGEQHIEEFASALAYARLRGLETNLPAVISRYSISTPGLAQLRQRYHVLAMPSEAWSDPAFMGLLLDNGLPYARLNLLRMPGAPEILMLPKTTPASNALGEGLRLTGAPDVASYLEDLLEAR
ncbi:DUF6685 family protein [Pseudomonas sp. LRF_L74]|uniref:DUF6685 family protein n=1 Tax=Pseudomonas sp. LRF_L74 TaxID=3369422 RepID=UPI003F60D86D